MTTETYVITRGNVLDLLAETVSAWSAMPEGQRFPWTDESMSRLFRQRTQAEYLEEDTGPLPLTTSGPLGALLTVAGMDRSCRSEVLAFTGPFTEWPGSAGWQVCQWWDPDDEAVLAVLEAMCLAPTPADAMEEGIRAWKNATASPWRPRPVWPGLSEDEVRLVRGLRDLPADRRWAVLMAVG